MENFHFILSEFENEFWAQTVASHHMQAHENVNKFVSPGTLRSVRAESALPEGLRAEAELQRSRCGQMGALHRPQRHL